MPRENLWPPLIRFLDTVGDGSGTKSANVDYSVTPATFLLKPPTNQIFILSELLIHLADASNFSVTGFGSLSALTNGVKIYAKRNGVTVLDILDGESIKTTAHLLHLSSRAVTLDFAGGGNSITVSFNALDFGTAFGLYGNFTDSMEIILNDDFSGLTDFHFIAHGKIWPI